MKFFIYSAAFAILLSACATKKEFVKLDREPHPAYVHHMELMLADDVNSDDSATAVWAKEFMDGFEPAYRAYKPDLSIIKNLNKYRDSLEIKVIGGNWCSDTRRELPRLCKVLAYIGVPEGKLSYYKVDHDKKPRTEDFASEYKFTFIPTIVVYINHRERGKIVEVTRYSMEKDLLNLLESRN